MHILHPPIVMEGARGNSTNMYDTGGVFHRTCTYNDMLIYMLWSDYQGIDQLVLGKGLHTDVQAYGRKDRLQSHQKYDI